MKKSLLGTLLAGLIFAPIGYFVAFHFGKPIVDNAKASTQWPSVDGVVQRSKVVTSRNSNSKTMYSADVLYKYNVGGSELSGNTVFFGGNFSSSSSRHAHAVTNRYPVRSPVKVYYDPKEPGNAVLEPGAKWSSYLVFGIGLLFLTVGGLMLAGPICKLGIGTMVVAGAASGAIGARKTAVRTSGKVPGGDATSGQQPVSPAKSGHDDDDGFDIA